MIRKTPWKTVSKKRGTVLNFRKANNLTKVRETKFPKIPGMKISENLDIPREAVLAFVNSRKCCSIGQWKFPENQTRIFTECKVPLVSVWCMFLNCYPRYHLVVSVSIQKQVIRLHSIIRYMGFIHKRLIALLQENNAKEYHLV